MRRPAYPTRRMRTCALQRAESPRAGVAALLCYAQKAESLSHISVGQRPTYKAPKNFKAESLADKWWALMRKGFALESFSAPLRRALPYASMRKAFSLENSFAALRRAAGLRPLPYASMRKGFALWSGMLAALVMGMAVTAQAATYYVSTNGNDTATGTS